MDLVPHNKDGITRSFSNDQLEPGGLLTLMGVGVANGVIAAGLTLLGLFLVDNLFGIITPIRLLDLAQPTHPLLRRLILNAPGTYHHSLMVSNLAEQAAEQIGADALLTRVGAYYHDVGKLQRPFFFIENQFREINIHERLDPQVSAQTIISHVQNGLNLAQKYRLPREVRAFIAEHHGTGLVEYFYHQARQETADPAQVPEADFRYPGPKPQSRETALVMLADSCEAAVRAVQPVSLKALDQLVRDTILNKVGSTQLDQCHLTLHDLEVIRHTFVELLQGAFHQRITRSQQQEAQQEIATGATPAMLPAPSPPALVMPHLRSTH